jgi:glyoxylase-like metal-dependent hydrolase (beta-lactamase superfamily II)
MGALSKLFFPPGPTAFKFAGHPAKFQGPSHIISSTCVATKTFNDEPLKLHCIPGYASALYIVQYPARGHFVLLDCGSPTDAPRIKFYVEDVLSESDGVPYKLQEHLKLAVSSHCHIDHSGAARAYEELGVTIAEPAFMNVAYKGKGGRVAQLAESCMLLYVGKRNGRAVEDPFHHSHGLLGPYWSYTASNPVVLRDGTPLPLGFDDWVAVHIPGHTDHMVGMYHVPSRSFYAADLMVRLRKGFFSPQPLHYEWAFTHTFDRLRDLDVACLLLPHSGVVDVAEVCGSWDNLIDEVTHRHTEQRKRTIMGEKSLLAAFQLTVARASRRLLTAKRNFTPADLPTGPLPQPLTPSYGFTISK